MSELTRRPDSIGPMVGVVAPIADIQRIIAEPADPSPKADRSEFIAWSAAIDTVALFLQETLALDGETRVEQPGVAAAFDTSFAWLDGSLEAVTDKAIRTYAPNSRIAPDDLRQTAREYTIESLIPDFDPDEASFLAFYRANLWRGLDAVVGKNMSQLSTSVHFLRRTSAAKHLAMQATSYDALAATEEVYGRSSQTDIVDQLSARALMATIIYTLANDMSELERAAVVTTRINGQPYAALMEEHGVSFRTVDNALQRGMAKLAKKVVPEAA